MPRTRLFLKLASLFALAALAFAVAAVADHGRRHEGEGAKLLRSTLAPSMPTDPAFHGVTPGGVPWRLNRGAVRIERSGEFDLRVDGLVIPSLGNAGPVKTISASLYCGADANATAAATTQQVPLSSDGDARIHARVTLPAACLAPIVLVHPNGVAARYIAVTGWRS